MRKNYRLFLLCLLTVSLLSIPASAQDDKAAAVKTLNDFYQFHRAHKNVFNKAQLNLRKKWLTPELYQLLLREDARETREARQHPDEKPYFEGLPFTAIEEYPPPKWKMGDAKVEGDTAQIEMKYVYGKGGKDRESKWTVEMKKVNAAWLISNIIYEDGDDLLKTLKERADGK
jgi:hypothetical protein